MSIYPTAFRSDTAFLLTVPLPGVALENIELYTKQNRLFINASREPIAAKPIQLEKRRKTYNHSFPLPSNLDLENIQAKFETGVLFIELAKKDTRARIPIKAA